MSSLRSILEYWPEVAGAFVAYNVHHVLHLMMHLLGKYVGKALKRK